jgi:hypothetical protein
MSNKKTLNIIIILIAIAIALFAIFFLTQSRIRYVNGSDYDALYEQLTDPEGISSDKDLRSRIESWAKSADLDYTADKYGNVIIDVPATAGKEGNKRLVICTEYNYLLLDSLGNPLTTAAYIASNSDSNGPITVIFANNKNNYHEGIAHLSASLFGKGDDVIYLDANPDTSYISSKCFSSALLDATMPYSTEAATCDTAVHINISGLTEAAPSKSAASRPSLTGYYSAIVNRLRSKSVAFQVGSLSIPSSGNMYPSSLDMVLLINSYSLEDFTGYLDKRIEEFDEDYSEDYPDAAFTYEVLESVPADISPMSAETTDILSNFLYTVKNGNYKYTEDNAPTQNDIGIIYGTNTVESIVIKDGSVHTGINVQAVDDVVLEQIINDNTAAATLSNASIQVTDKQMTFRNPNSRLSDSLRIAFRKANTVGKEDIELSHQDDLYYTPANVLDSKADGMDVVHVSISDKNRIEFTNALMYYSTGIQMQ